jgi:hypothetical protein
MSEQPLWRQAYDKVDKALTPTVTEVVQSDTFNLALGLGAKVRKTVGKRVGSTAATVWHLVNLPAGTDVRRLRQQVGALDREVRRLTLQLERERHHHGDEHRLNGASHTSDRKE